MQNLKFNLSSYYSESEEWKEQRRFTLRALKDFGLSKTTMETLIQKEIDAFNDSLKKECGKAIDMRQRFNLSVVNALWTITTGNRLSPEDPDFLKLVDRLDWTMGEFGRRKIFNGLPWLRYISPKMSGWKKFAEDIHAIRDFIYETVKPHLSSYNYEGKNILKHNKFQFRQGSQ